MNINRLTWTNDIRAALLAIGYDTDGYDPLCGYFNDLHRTCRRIKFTLSNDKVTKENLILMQEAIQARRPDLNVTVSKWVSTAGRWGGFGNVVIYYRPKVGLYL
jgi:hypothetical protein